MAEPLKWPPDYTAILMERQRRFIEINRDPSLIIGAKAFYPDHPIKFIEDWCITYDPRNAQKDLPTLLPFVLFPRQKLFIKFLQSCLADQACGLVEKSRDIGATWLSCAFSVWLWLYVPGSSVGWGSRKEQLVDKLGDPDSIFEKIRMILNFLPKQLWPLGFDIKQHATYMRLINKESSATITGEAGDNIGRGGRKLIYFKDESAHYEHPEKIEAALGDNTNVQMDISSVHGTGNIFARKRQSGEIWEPDEKIDPGIVRVFVFDWSDHPAKTTEWYNNRREKAEREGLLHIFAQEVDRDYSAAVEGLVIKKQWITASVDAHIKLGFDNSGKKIASLDVADEGGDRNAYCMRAGNVLEFIKSWAEGDTGETTQKAIFWMKKHGVKEIQYDCIGVGAGVKAEANRLNREGLVDDLKFIAWSAAKEPQTKNKRLIRGDKSSPVIKDFFSNLKAQAWWNARNAFEKTFKAVTKGVKYPTDELISLSSDVKELRKLEQELSQPTYSFNGQGKIVIDKKPEGTKSPNLADAFVMCFWPVTAKKVLI